MRYGLVEVVLLGGASGLVGVFVVQRQLTFFAHALNHTIFPAVVLAAALRLDLTVGANARHLPLAVIEPAADELAAHREYLAALEVEIKRRCIWLVTETVVAEVRIPDAA